MGLSVLAYVVLGASGLWMRQRRIAAFPRPVWVRPFHYATGAVMVVLVLGLLAIGLVGTIGHYGNLGHSPHLFAGLGVVGLVLASAGSATQIGRKPRARSLHLSINLILFLSLAWVSWTGWAVVQKYLP